jgi:hypothetical protein
MVETKYDSMRGGWCSKEVGGHFGVGVWKYIRRGLGAFLRFIRYEVGDGSKTRFWHDLWCGDQPLKETFLDAWVVDHMQFINGNLQWNISFTRPVHNWEVDLVTSFFELLYSIRLRQAVRIKYVGSPPKGRSLK